jgi:hypothetical protein
MRLITIHFFGQKKICRYSFQNKYFLFLMVIFLIISISIYYFVNFKNLSTTNPNTPTPTVPNATNSTLDTTSSTVPNPTTPNPTTPNPTTPNPTTPNPTTPNPTTPNPTTPMSTISTAITENTLVATGNGIIFSQDMGKTWLSKSTNRIYIFQEKCISIIKGKNLWVTISKKQIAYSYDFSTWTLNTALYSNWKPFKCLYYFNNLWFIGRFDFLGKKTLLTSVDGINWAENDMTNRLNSSINKIYGNKNLLFAVGDRWDDNLLMSTCHGMLSTDNGSTWALFNNTPCTIRDSYATCIYSNSNTLFVMAFYDQSTDNSGLSWSENGSSWVDSNFRVDGKINDISFNENIWVAIKENLNFNTPNIVYSADGKNWNILDKVIFPSTATSIKWFRDRWIMSGYDIEEYKTIAYSLDGITWSVVKTPINETAFITSG